MSNPSGPGKSGPHTHCDQFECIRSGEEKNILSTIEEWNSLEFISGEITWSIVVPSVQVKPITTRLSRNTTYGLSNNPLLFFSGCWGHWCCCDMLRKAILHEPKRNVILSTEIRTNEINLHFWTQILGPIAESARGKKMAFIMSTSHCCINWTNKMKFRFGKNHFTTPATNYIRCWQRITILFRNTSFSIFYAFDHYKTKFEITDKFVKVHRTLSMEFPLKHLFSFFSPETNKWK